MKKQSPEEPVPTLTLRETVDKTLVDKLLLSDLELSDNTIAVLLKYLETRDGTMSVDYQPSDDSPNGRLYSKHGFQNLDKRCRAYLCHRDYIDIDLENAAPRIVAELARDHSLSTPHLDNYISNRDKTLKTDVIMALFNWNSEIKPTQKHYALFNEIRETSKKIAPDVHAFSKMIWNLERKLIDKFINILNEEKIKVSAIVFDGVIVHRHDGINAVIERFNNTTPHHKLIVKPWQVPDLKITDHRQFDFGDPTCYNDLRKRTSILYSSVVECFAHNYKLLIKTVRLIDPDTFIVKTSHRTVDFKRKQQMSFKIRGKPLLPIGALLRVWSKMVVTRTVPFEPTSDDDFSTFTGFLPQYDKVPSNWKDVIKPICDHIAEVWCAKGRDENWEHKYNYVITWFATLVQKLKKTDKIILINGGEGAGKSIITDWIGKKIFGDMAITFTGCEKITGSFNAHLSGKLLVFMEELAGTGDARAQRVDANRIKHICTGNTLDVTRKNVDTSTEEQRLNLFGFSNGDNPLPPIEGMNRRLATFRVSTKYQNNTSYFKNLVSILESEDAPVSFYHYLKTFDLNTCKLSMVPHNEEYATNAFNVIHDVCKACYYLIDKHMDDVIQTKWVSSAEIKSIVDRMNRHSNNKFEHSLVQIGKKLTQQGFPKKKIDGKYYFGIGRDEWPEFKESMLNAYIDIKYDLDIDFEDDNAPRILDDEISDQLF